MTLGLVVACLIAFGVGYISGALDTAKRIMYMAVEVLGIEEVGAAELFQQYLKLKGGT